TNLLICHGLLAARAMARARRSCTDGAAPAPTVVAPALVAGSEGIKAKSGSRAWSWAALMHRAFAIDVLAYAPRHAVLQLGRAGQVLLALYRVNTPPAARLTRRSSCLLRLRCPRSDLSNKNRDPCAYDGRAAHLHVDP